MNDVAIARPPGLSRFDPQQVDLIKRQICPGASDDELQLFIQQCNRTGLDPFSRQIYSIERRERNGDSWVTKRSTQVSIDGMRLIAERSGKYAGQTEPEWCGPDGKWRSVWLSSQPPVAARVGVLRRDFAQPCYAVARFDAYAQRGRDGSPTRMWTTMPDLMLAKCAESLALRKAFPQDLSGIPSSDEMAQADEPLPVYALRHQPPPPPHDPETGEIWEPVEPHEIAIPEASTGLPNWIAWGSAFVAQLQHAEDAATLEAWILANGDPLNACELEMPKVYERIQGQLRAARERLQPDLIDAPAA